MHDCTQTHAVYFISVTVGNRMCGRLSFGSRFYQLLSKHLLNAMDWGEIGDVMKM